MLGSVLASCCSTIGRILEFTIVVGRRREPRQTKESARLDKRPSPGYCVAICFYCMGQKHLFLLCGSKPYAGWRQPVCHLFLLCGSKPSAGPSVFVGVCYESYHLSWNRLLVT